MVAALMALVQASNMTQERLARCSETASAKPGNAKGHSTATSLKHETSLPVPEAMQQLVDVVTKLSTMDKLIQQARDMVPEGGDARKWHLVSLTVLEWTRNAQAEQVQVLLEKVKAGAVAQASPSVQAMAPPRHPASKVEPAGIPVCTAEPTHGPPGLLGPEADTLPGAPPKLGSLRADLEKLRGHDPDCCLIVRRIKHLGIESASVLEEHFSRAGRVAAVYVSHSFEKPCQKRRNGRIRPATLGFVVMATKEGAERALAGGSEQLVRQAHIGVKLFEPFAEDLEQ